MGQQPAQKCSTIDIFGPRGHKKCVCSLRETLGRLRKTPKRRDQGSGPSKDGVETKEEANFKASQKADKGAGRSATQPQWPRPMNRTERSRTSVKRPEGPRTTSLTRRTTRTKTMAWMTRSTRQARHHCRKETYLTTTQCTTTYRELHCNWTEQGCQHSAGKDSRSATMTCRCIAIGQMPAR